MKREEKKQVSRKDAKTLGDSGQWSVVSDQKGKQRKGIVNGYSLMVNGELPEDGERQKSEV